jgi:hypothetical protein
VVSIDPDEAPDHGIVAQQERYRTARSSHVAISLEVVGLSQMGVQALDGYCNGATRANKNFFACDERDVIYGERFLLLQHVESEVSG